MSLFLKNEEGDTRYDFTQFKLKQKETELDFAYNSLCMIPFYILTGLLLKENKYPNSKDLVLNDITIIYDASVSNIKKTFPSLSSVLIHLIHLLYKKYSSNFICFMIDFPPFLFGQNKPELLKQLKVIETFSCFDQIFIRAFPELKTLENFAQLCNDLSKYIEIKNTCDEQTHFSLIDKTSFTIVIKEQLKNIMHPNGSHLETKISVLPVANNEDIIWKLEEMDKEIKKLQFEMKEMQIKIDKLQTEIVLLQTENTEKYDKIGKLSSGLS